MVLGGEECGTGDQAVCVMPRAVSVGRGGKGGGWVGARGLGRVGSADFLSSMGAVQHGVGTQPKS